VDFFPCLLTPKELMRLDMLGVLDHKHCKTCGGSMPRKMGKTESGALAVRYHCSCECQYELEIRVNARDSRD